MKLNIEQNETPVAVTICPALQGKYRLFLEQFCILGRIEKSGEPYSEGLHKHLQVPLLALMSSPAARGAAVHDRPCSAPPPGDKPRGVRGSGWGCGPLQTQKGEITVERLRNGKSGLNFKPVLCLECKGQ